LSVGRPATARRCVVAFLAAVFLARTPGAQAATPGPDAVGFGAHPLTAVCASAWFVAGADDKTKRLVLITYIMGKPGWVAEGANFNSNLQKRPAEISFVAGSVPVLITYDAGTGEATLQGQTFELAHDNVFVITATGFESASVRALGVHDLKFAGSDNPALELVARDAKVRAALLTTGRPAPVRTQGVKTSRKAPSPRAAALYKDGHRFLALGDPKSTARACSLFAQAASLGMREAQYSYGYCLQSGEGRKQDLVAANKWYAKAAAQGDPDAAFKLGWSARQGRGMDKDPAQAMQWFQRCAAEGDSICEALVGQMYERGEGVPASADSALLWYGRSAERGIGDAQYAYVRLVAGADSNGADAATALLWLEVLVAQRQQLPKSWVVDLERWRPQFEQSLSADARGDVERRAEAWLIENSNRSLEAMAR
jgi:TPR repeat protein